MAGGQNLFTGGWRFLTAATSPAHFPPGDVPEVAFAGRSNVGKSSLLNALTGQRALARTSHTPGRTRQINFFECDGGDGGGRLRLVDMPGYGYAKTSRAEIKSWQRLARAYFNGRRNLVRLFVLIDSRRGIGDNDRAFFALPDEAGISWVAVLTRADKAKPHEAEATAKAVAAEVAGHPAAFPGLFITSSRTRAGVEELREHTGRLAL